LRANRDARVTVVIRHGSDEARRVGEALAQRVSALGKDVAVVLEPMATVLLEILVNDRRIASVDPGLGATLARLFGGGWPPAEPIIADVRATLERVIAAQGLADARRAGEAEKAALLEKERVRREGRVVPGEGSGERVLVDLAPAPPILLAWTEVSRRVFEDGHSRAEEYRWELRCGPREFTLRDAKTGAAVKLDLGLEQDAYRTSKPPLPATRLEGNRLAVRIHAQGHSPYNSVDTHVDLTFDLDSMVCEQNVVTNVD
jgi:hypothetical protein